MTRKPVHYIDLLYKYVMSIPKLAYQFNFKTKNRKYSLKDYLEHIAYVHKTGIAWRDLRCTINWNSVYKVYVKLVNFNIFQLTYIDLLKIYYKKDNHRKQLSSIITDTTFIQNKRGYDLTGYNKYYGKKWGTKISLLTDVKGIPINVKCYKGNQYDSEILKDHVKQKDLTENNNKKYFLADTGYDNKLLREQLVNLDYIPIISYNRRNTKDPKKIRRLTKAEKKIFKKRSTIERAINELKMNRRINLRYDSKCKHFLGFVYLSLIKFTYNKI